MLLPLPGALESLLILLMALLLDACIGDVRWLERILPRPVDLSARVAAWFDKRLNRIDRGDRARRARGALMVMIVAAGAAAAGILIAAVTRQAPGGWILEMLLVARCLDLRRPWTGMEATGAALERGGVDAGRAAVAPLTDRQAWTLDFHGIIRAAVEHGGRSLLTGLVAPALFHALLGPPGLLLWVAAAGMRRAVGHTGLPRFQQFGRTAAGLYALLAAVPAWLTVAVIALAALFVPRGRAGRAIAVPVKSARCHPMGAEARPVAALAGALDLSLAGPRREGEVVVQEPWLGDGRARAMGKDLRPALSLYAVTVVITAGLILAAVAASLR